MVTNLAGDDTMDTAYSAAAGHLSMEEQQLLVMRFAPLVRKIARSVPHDPGLIEFEDAVGFGMCGLVEAVRRYRPTADDNFQAFATKRIRGAMLDAVRRADRLTRTMREKAQAARKAETNLQAELERAPTAAEVAQRLGVTVGQYREQAAHGRWATVSLDRLLTPGEDGDLSPGVEKPSADEDRDITQALDQREQSEDLALAVKALPERERLVVALYYVEQLSMRDVAAVLTVSESRASQLHTQALRRLRRALEQGAA